MNTRTSRRQRRHAFTSIDLAAIAVVLSLLALLALPILAGNATTSTGVTCVGNLQKLALAWQLYATDNSGKLMNNFGTGDMNSTASSGAYANWSHNWMDWSTNPSNTNRTLMATSKLYPYLQNPILPFKCPSDRFVSSVQTQAGWTSGRVRSYSMNGYMGPYAISTADPSYRGMNMFTPTYRQFIKSSSIPYPEKAIVLLDEHPDSLNDGYFINVPNTSQWYDLPGSHHNGAGGVSFADGHVEMHSWLYSSTKVAVRYGFASWGPISSSQRGDHTWLTSRMTVTHPTLALTRSENQATVAWSPTTSTYALQSSSSLAEPNWQNVPETAVTGSGQVAVTADTTQGERFFRLIRP